MDSISSAKGSKSQYTNRHYQLAYHHATILQQQKDTESMIMENLEELIDYPSAAYADAQRPSSTDIARFSGLVRPFQVSDYDSLIEERNAAGNCGYVFCPSPCAKSRASGTHSVIMNGSRGRDLQVISSDKARSYCNTACTKRAMFIKVQLSEVPAWERAGGLGKPIEIMREDDERELEQRMNSINLQDVGEEEIQRAMEELALERGDGKTSAKPRLVMTNQIREKQGSS